MEAKNGYVSEEKLEEIEKVEVSDREEISRDAFLVGCYTDLRFSDIKQLRSEHFNGEWIKKTMQKTKLEVCIPYAKAAGMPIAFRHGMRAAVILSFGLQCIL